MNTSQENGFPPSLTGLHEERSYLPVLISGLATTVLALLGIYALDVNVKDFNIMGWYANYVIPAGAIIVGIVAASGYGLASWFSGIKITSRLLWTVLALQLFAYFAAQYIEFHNLHLIHREDGRSVGFLEYYDAVARSFAWRQSDGSVGEPLGAWGYFFRGLEVLGFVGGGLIVPLVLRKAPYCPECQRYMKTRQLGLVPASVPAKKVKKSDLAGKAATRRSSSNRSMAENRPWPRFNNLPVATRRRNSGRNWRSCSWERNRRPDCPSGSTWNWFTANAALGGGWSPKC